jgi:hypothetical protein
VFGCLDLCPAFLLRYLYFPSFSDVPPSEALLKNILQYINIRL